MKTANHALSQVSKGPQTTKHKQRGNGLFYTLLGSALLAAGSYFAFGIYQDRALDASIQADIANIQDTVQMTQRLFGRRNDYASQSIGTLVQSGAIPSRLRIIGTNTAINAFGQSISIDDRQLSQDTMPIIWPVPKAACMSLVTAIAGVVQAIDVNATNVKPAGGALNSAETVTQCDATIGSVVTIGVSVGRFAAND